MGATGIVAWSLGSCFRGSSPPVGNGEWRKRSVNRSTLIALAAASRRRLRACSERIVFDVKSGCTRLCISRNGLYWAYAHQTEPRHWRDGKVP